MQGMSSSQFIAVPGWQAPATHNSVPLHCAVSAHDEPSATEGYVHTPVPVLHVAPVAVWHTGGALHVTAVQLVINTPTAVSGLLVLEARMTMAPSMFCFELVTSLRLPEMRVLRVGVNAMEAVEDSL